MEGGGQTVHSSEWCSPRIQQREQNCQKVGGGFRFAGRVGRGGAGHGNNGEAGAIVLSRGSLGRFAGEARQAPPDGLGGGCIGGGGARLDRLASGSWGRIHSLWGRNGGGWGSVGAGRGWGEGVLSGNKYFSFRNAFQGEMAPTTTQN